MTAAYENIRVWIATQPGARTGDTIVALLNLGSRPRTVRADWEALGLGSPSRAVLDVLSGKQIGKVTAVDVQLPAHASAVYRLH